MIVDRVTRPARLVERIRKAVGDLSLDLHGATVLTEAATGHYVVTPIVAALSGAAKVYALARDSRYGTVADVRERTATLARAAGVADRVRIVTAKTPEIVGQADIVTNSGHLRPIDREVIRWMKPTAVVPLMYEAWEYRSSDVDLTACAERGIPAAGTNEEHPAVGVFNYLGIAVIKQLLQCGVRVWGSRILLLCDNRFGPHIEGALMRSGAKVRLVDAVQLHHHPTDGPFDAVVVAMTPRESEIVGRSDALISVETIQRYLPGGPIVQFLGDVDRPALDAAGMVYWPPRDPGKGHMGVLLSEVGLQPVLRLQTGSLKVGEELWRVRAAGGTPRQAVDAVVASGYGQYLPVVDYYSSEVTG